MVPAGRAPPFFEKRTASLYAQENIIDRRLYSPAALRNREPILQTLRQILPRSGVVLEVASGSGEHVIHFAAHLPAVVFQPSDPSPEAVSSIADWRAESGLDNIRPPIQLDASWDIWPVEAADAIICINMIHISPWPATEGLMRHAGAILKPGAPLYLYGPFRQTGIAWAESNDMFDASLRARDPGWGVRHLDVVSHLAALHCFGPPDIFSMPANNLGVVFKRR